MSETTIAEKRTIQNKKYQKRYWQSEKGKANRKRFEQSTKGKIARKRYKQSKKGKATSCRANNKFNRLFPERRKAVNAVNFAIKAGKLPRPDTLQCSYGNHPAGQYHHHKGYKPEHWLDVIPACIKCHKKIHYKKAS